MNDLEWKDYPGDRLIAKHEKGFYVIKPRNYVNSSPIFCPVCESIMKTQYDEEAYTKFQCCESCSNKWVYPDMSRWMSGWRPNSDE